jgi:uncharacterized protein
MKFSGLISFVIAVSIDAFALQLPDKPPNSLVYDEDRLMSAQQIDYFNELANELFRKTGVFIAAALVDDIESVNIHTYASRTAEKWEIGGTSGNAILILSALKQRSRAVEIGTGAEPLLTKVRAERLQQELLVPAFRKDKYGEGILALAYAISNEIAQQKGTSLEIKPFIPEETPMTVQGWIFIVVVFGLLVFIGRKGRRFGFFDNMKKLLCVSEIENSDWPGIFRNTLGDNLVTAFLSGKCLMEGFDALASPWTISFILKDNSPEQVAKIRAYEKRARRENLEFARFYSLAEISRALEGVQAHDDPLFYGVYYLETGTYPENNKQVTEYFHDLYQEKPAEA